MTDKDNCILEVLRECEEYMDNRSDADHDGIGFIPNDEMILLYALRKAIKMMEPSGASVKRYDLEEKCDGVYAHSAEMVECGDGDWVKWEDVAGKVYTIGDKTMEAVFQPAGLTNVSDLQAVFDAVEKALVASQQLNLVGYELSQDNSAQEQRAFEAWASSHSYSMLEHPLHYLFLDPKTDAARQGWKAALQYVRKHFATTEGQNDA